MWGIIPAAGLGSRIQPLAFSKELLPVGSRVLGDHEQPCAVSEYLLSRMLIAGAKRLCFVVAPGKSDIVNYFGNAYGAVDICYVVQPSPLGLCDAICRAVPFVHSDEQVLVGLPDTVWFPENALCKLGDVSLGLLLFPVTRPEAFDVVLTDDAGRVQRVYVKPSQPPSQWIWGAIKMRGSTLHALSALWRRRECADVYLGTLINAYIETGGDVVAVRGGEAYVDIGTLRGYREATALLEDRAAKERARGESDAGRKVISGPSSG